MTIPRLLELAPPGTPDPSPLLYNTTMYGIAGMLTIAAAANFMIKPVDPKYHLIEERESAGLRGGPAVRCAGTLWKGKKKGARLGA